MWTFYADRQESIQNRGILQYWFSAGPLEHAFVVAMNHLSDLPLDMKTCVALAIIQLNIAYAGFSTIYSIASTICHGEQSMKWKWADYGTISGDALPPKLR